MCSCEDAERPKVFESIFRKSRSIGCICRECNARINDGRWYQDISLLADSWQRYRLCLRCSARHEAYERLEECGAPYGDVRTCIRDSLHAMDRDEWFFYGEEFRLALDRIRSTVDGLELVRAQRYRLAGESREQKKRTASTLGEGI